MPRLADLRTDLLTCLGFYTRLPLPEFSPPPRGFAAAQWAAPFAGFVIAIVGWAVWQAGSLAGLAAGPAAALVLAATLLFTGCLHEDGLADTADGLGGGRTRERALEIMRDSRIGTYGAAALGLSLLLRWAALAELGSATHAFAALVAAHMASRAFMPVCLAWVSPARGDGLSAGTGRCDAVVAATAVAIGLAGLSMLGAGAALTAVILLAVIFLGMRRLCLRKIGGQTGDTLGALQQLGEIAVLLVASSAL